METVKNMAVGLLVLSLIVAVLVGYGIALHFTFGKAAPAMFFCLPAGAFLAAAIGQEVRNYLARRRLP